MNTLPLANPVRRLWWKTANSARRHHWRRSAGGSGGDGSECAELDDVIENGDDVDDSDADVTNDVTSSVAMTVVGEEK